MASAMYTQAKEDFIGGNIDMDTDVIKARIVSDADYTFSAAHTAMSSVTKYSGTTDYTLTSQTITGGVFDAADGSPAFSSVSQDASKTVDAIVIFKFVTDDAGSTPILYIDLSFRVTPNGGDLNITWDSGANKIFALS